MEFYPRASDYINVSFFVLCLFLYSIKMFSFYYFDFIETSVTGKVGKHETVILANKKTVLWKDKTMIFSQI